jgi:hypothetical protein
MMLRSAQFISLCFEHLIQGLPNRAAHNLADMSIFRIAINLDRLPYFLSNRFLSLT